MACSIASTLDVIGEPWSPLIVRDVWLGIRRFDEIQADLGISRKVLAERLKTLVEAGVLAKQQYSDRPVRSQYLLTAKGLDLVELLMVMVKWGDRWTAGEEGPPVLYRHHSCGEIAHVELHCSACDQPMTPGTVDLLPGTGH
jgi:DNA-binding HxlR family transcriptional regulator